MRIGIDANMAIYENAGIGRYTTNIINNILMVDKKNQYTVFFNFLRKNNVKKEKIKEIINNNNKAEIKISYIPDEIKNKLLRFYFPSAWLYANNLDILHQTYFSSIPNNLNSKTKLITTIYDLVFYYYPEHRGHKLSLHYLNQTKKAINKSSAIITISENTKQDLVKILGANPRKINVIYLAPSKIFKKINQKVKEKKISLLKEGQKYILSVGTLEPRKNLTNLLGAYSLLSKKIKNDYKLVLIGKKGWNNNDFDNMIKNKNIKNNVIITGHVSDEELLEYYNFASLFVYPSLYEGFGLPVVEAMACGTPVITSNISSMPEIVKNKEMMFSPKNEREIAQKIEKIITNKKLSQKLGDYGLKRAKKFSWEKTAQETINVYEKVMEKAYENSY